MPIDIRFNPFKDLWEPYNIVKEVLQVPVNNPFHVRLAEVPQKTSPTTLTVYVADTLAVDATAAQTSITVSNGAWFAPNDVILIDSERIRITAVKSNVLTVTRGYESTTPVNHVIGADVIIIAGMQEVAADPSAGQFWPDYNTVKGINEDWNTGTIEFNPQDAGKRLLISYMGIGTLADMRIVGYNRTVFFENGVLTIPPGTKEVFVSMCGGGGGMTTQTSDALYGYHGEFVMHRRVAVSEREIIEIAIGAGGTTPTGTNQWSGAGGASSFGSYLSAAGGSYSNSTNKGAYEKAINLLSFYDMITIKTTANTDSLGRGSGGRISTGSTTVRSNGRPGLVIVEYGNTLKWHGFTG